MKPSTIGALFTNSARAEAALAELRRAGFANAQISEAAEHDNGAAPERSGNPFIDFFSDHTASGSDFRDNLATLGMSDADAGYFEDGIARGAWLITVDAGERAAEAVAMLERRGADTGRQAAEPAAGPDGDVTLQLRAERLAIDKVRVASGAVRIRKDVITERQSIDVVLSHEELVIERHPVTDPAAVPGGTIGASETFTIPLSREHVNVRKETYVTEEIDIGKRAVRGTAHVSESVRHEELAIENDTGQHPRG